MASLDCSICHELFRDPRTLPCLHSFCLRCLEALSKQGLTSCPLCRSKVEIPKEELKDLPVDRFIFNLVQASLSNEDPNHLHCEICEEVSEAEFRCEECEQFLCGNCKKVHLKMKATKLHSICSLDDYYLVNKGGKPKRTACQSHHTQEMSSFCGLCKVPICPGCAVEFHSGHLFYTLAEAIPAIRNEIEDGIKDINKYHKELQEVLEVIFSSTREARSSSEEAKQAIFREFAAIREKVNEAEARLIQEVEETLVKKEKGFLIKREGIEFAMQGISEAAKRGELLLEKGTEIELAVDRKSLLARFQTLLNLKVDKEEASSGRIGFEKNGCFEIIEENLEELGVVISSYASPEHSLIRVEGIQQSKDTPIPVRVGFFFNFVVEGRDVKDKVTVGSFQAVIKGKEEEGKMIPLARIDEEGGYEGSFYATKVGDYELTVTMQGKELACCPLILSVYQGDGFPLPLLDLNRPFKLHDGPGSTLPGQFKNPAAVCVSPRGLAYVADCNNHQVQVFDQEGRFIFKFGTYGKALGQFHGPYGISMDRRGSRVLVSDMYNHRIQVFNEQGHHLSMVGTQGSGDGQLSHPYGCCTDSEGNIYVADHGNHRIQVFSEHGQFLRKFGEEGTKEGQLRNPFGIGIDSKGNVVVSELRNHRISIFDREGKFIRTVGAGLLSHPLHLALDRADKIVVCNHDAKRIFVFDQEGVLQKSIGEGLFLQPYGVSLGQGGKVLVVDWNKHKVHVF